MKKYLALFAMIVAVSMLFLSSLTGCMNQSPDKNSKTESGFNYDMLMQMSTTYVGEADCSCQAKL